MMKKVHITENYCLNPQHPVTVNLIGIGGTGSQVLTCLARIDAALLALGHPGLHVVAYDPDTVTEANIGRQLFSGSDIGLNKAICLVTRINRFFGKSWDAVPENYRLRDQNSNTNIYITCTDNIKSRVDLDKYLKCLVNNNYVDYSIPLYWLDFGNTQVTGQVILGTIGEIKQPKLKGIKTVGKLKTVTEMFDFSQIKDDDSGPSCSLAEAINKQDLFINSTLAQLGCNLIWKLISQGRVETQGLYLNLETMNVNPIKL